MIAFFVPGIPRPAGSKRAYTVQRADGRIGVGVADMSGQHGKHWRKAVQWEAKRARGHALPFAGPVELICVFVMPRPKAHFGKAGLRVEAPDFHALRPDATKLLRAVEDACTGILWHDDAQVVEQHVVKRYGDTPGVKVEVAPKDAAGSRAHRGTRPEPAEPSRASSVESAGACGAAVASGVSA